MIVLDVLAAAFLLAGCLLMLVAAIGLLRFPDVLSRMHAATKPQTLALVLVLLGTGLRLRDGGAAAQLVLVVLFIGATAPVAAHMLGRAAYRHGRVDRDGLVVDELSDELDRLRAAGAWVPTPGPSAMRDRVEGTGEPAVGGPGADGPRTLDGTLADPLVGVPAPDQESDRGA